MTFSYNKAPGDYYDRRGILKKANAITGKCNSMSTNNKIALFDWKGKTAAAACIGCWLAEKGYEYGASSQK